jgi:hypothetical protein
LDGHGQAAAVGQVQTARSVFYIESAEGRWNVSARNWNGAGNLISAKLSTAHAATNRNPAFAVRVDDAGTLPDRVLTAAADQSPLLVGELALLISESKLTLSADGSYGTDGNAAGSVFAILETRAPPQHLRHESCVDGSVSVVTGKDESELVGATINWVCWQFQQGANGESEFVREGVPHYLVRLCFLARTPSD